MKELAGKVFARIIRYRMNIEEKRALKDQEKILQYLVRQGRATAFGKDHLFSQIHHYADFKDRVPVVGYEEISHYIERIKSGERNVLWPGVPLYFAKTSGTTSGAKYIPISRESMGHHITAARNALLSYIALGGNSKFITGKMIFLQGSPSLEKLPSGIAVGRLSGIVAHFVPKYLQQNRLPSYEINCIEDWETKVNAIVQSTVNEKMTLISGIPSWVQMYFEFLIQHTGKKNIADIFPHFSLFVYGGVNFEPYRKRFEQLIGKKIDTIETYPASEGFFAFQDKQDSDDLRLNTNAGIYFEFVPVSEYFNTHPTRYNLSEVKVGENYALLLSTNAGLWGYSIGDTIKFTSIHPYRIKVTGRIKHFTSAFGEHVIAEEVETAMKAALAIHPITVSEFHVAPQLNVDNELPFHEWFIESDTVPSDDTGIITTLNESMINQNIYYKDLIEGKVLQPLKITWVKPGSFNQAMKKLGRFGGQNKPPRLSNDRSFANELAI
jgi:hypothetical protein